MAQSVIDKLEVRDARWVPGALVVVLLSLLGAWLAVQTMESLHQMQRAEERARTLQQTAQALLGKTTGGPLRDAVAQLGLHEPLLKGLALGTLPPDARADPFRSPTSRWPHPTIGSSGPRCPPASPR